MHTSGKEGSSDPFCFEVAGSEGGEIGDKVYHRKRMRREKSQKAAWSETLQLLQVRCHLLSLLFVRWMEKQQYQARW